MITFQLLIKWPVSIIAFFMLVYTSYAQPTKVLRFKNGQDATKHISTQDRFQFMDFQSGKLYFANGKFTPAKLNYCYLNGEVMYIDHKGDTLLIDKNNRVSYAEIGKFIFHADPVNGYMQVVEEFGNIMLTKKHRYKMGGIEKKGAYNNKNEQGSVSNTANYTDPISGVTTSLPINNIVLLRPDLSYFIVDMNGRSFHADKHNLLKIFSRNKSAIVKYLNATKIDFNDEEDLKKAIRYCSELELAKS
ncbi:hypothetical protein [Dyadobacter sp. NIV53]|uniref:hypothetical protein n=1 Tax=Dyadobacter sp. NIV53 TaxID=2861765 RepID=UPI001C876EA6|nr:hypothetical protein [Dyadobacter sp. NIV53]